MDNLFDKCYNFLKTNYSSSFKNIIHKDIGQSELLNILIK